MEVLQATPKALLRKIQKMEDKLEKAEKKIRAQSKKIICCSKREKLLIVSRNSWKSKCKDKQQKIKGLKVKLVHKEKLSRHPYSSSIMKLSFLLRQQGKCSYLGISRILKILCFCGLLELDKIPCPNTIQNWVSKMGLYNLKNGHKSLEDKEVCLIIDESIKVGQERLLLIAMCAADKRLITPLPSISIGKGEEERAEQALSFENMTICYLEGRKSWTGDEIEKVLENLAKDLDIKISYIISDEASTLKKAIRQFDCPHVFDISHAVGNCLKRTFEKEEIYKNFTKTISGFQSRGVNQDLTYLIPPKQGTKARFMNQKPIVNWSIKLLDRFDKLSKKEKIFFNDLLTYKSFVELLSLLINCTETISLTLKNKGLSLETLEEVEKQIKLLEAIKLKEYQPYKAIYVQQIRGYMEQYKVILKQITEFKLNTINACSDVVESLFGKYKKITSSNALSSMINTAVELPIYCMNSKEVEEQFEDAFLSIFMTDLQNWKTEHSIENQAIRRLKFFKKIA